MSAIKCTLLAAILLLAHVTAECHALSDTIPFTLNDQSNICIRACVNQTDTLLLMFHSATTGLTLTNAAVSRMSSLHNFQTTRVDTWGGSEETRFSEGNLLSIGRQRWDSLTVFTDEYSGEGTDGKFGYDLFKGKIVEIDYNHRWFIVHTELPRLPKGFWKTGLVEKEGSLYLPGTLKLGKTVYRDTFMFHTGYGGSILLDPNIGRQYGMQDRLPTIHTSELSDAFGNVFTIETKELPLLQVGGKWLKKVPLSFSVRSSDIPMKVFGNGLMKRFHVVLDFQHRRMYLKKNGK